MKKKRWKKIVVYIVVFLLSLLGILFILFCTLIANPFESNYKQNLASLVPVESDSITYIHNAKQLWNDIQQTFPIQTLEKTMAFRQFSRTKEYKQLHQLWKNLQKQQQQANFEFLREEYLWKIVKGEVAAAVRWRKNKPQFLGIARIDFLVRVAEGMAPYVVSEEMAKTHNLDLNAAVKKVRLDANNTLFFAMQNDVVFISNNESYLQESWRLATNNSASVLSQSTTLKNRIENKTYPLLLYVKDDIVKKHVLNKVARQLRPLLEVKSLDSTLLSIELQPHIKIHGITKLKSLSQYHQKLYQIPAKQFASEMLPQKTYLKAQIPISIDVWWYIYQQIPKKMRRELDRSIAILNKSHQTTSFIEEYIFKHIDKQIIVVSAPIDYVKQDIDVLDPYPSACIIVPSPTAREFYSYLKEMLQREVAKTKGKVKVVEDKYGNHDFLRIDIGGFDITGGAVQPVLTTLGDNLVFSSHISFLRDLVDVQDKIAPTWHESDLFKFGKNAQLLSPTIKINVAGKGIVKYIEDFQELWAEEMALTLFNRNPRGQKMQHIKARLLRVWRRNLNYAKSFDVNALVEIEPSPDEILWNIALNIDFIY